MLKADIADLRTNVFVKILALEKSFFLLAFNADVLSDEQIAVFLTFFTNSKNTPKRVAW